MNQEYNFYKTNKYYKKLEKKLLKIDFKLANLLVRVVYEALVFAIDLTYKSKKEKT